MSLTSRELELVVSELQALKGAIVQKAFVPEPRTVLLEVRKPGESHYLLLCAESGRTRIHVATDRPRSPEPPYAFQGLLRAELTGMAIHAIEAVQNERAVTVRFVGKDRAFSLVGELTGRHGNLFLVEGDGRIRASAVPNLSEKRDNRPGQTYTPLLPRPEVPAGDEKSRFAPTSEPWSLSKQLEAAYAVQERREQIAERRRLLVGGLKAKHDKVARTVEKVKGDLARMAKADEHKARGELLKANLHLVKRGMKEVRLTEWTEEGPREVTVTLDPSKTPKENLDRAFHQYKRLTAGQARARARLDELERERAALAATLEKARAMTDDELLAAPGPVPRPLAPKRVRARVSLPYREYVSASGQHIRVGRGAKENDALTLRHAKGNDAWLHARGVPGAHVTVPLQRDEQLLEETLKDAALLAVQFSDAKGQDRVEVAHTKVKYVRKGKGSAPGAVTYTQDRTWVARQDPERLARLLASAPEET